MILECRHHASLENPYIVRYHNAWIEFDRYNTFSLKKKEKYAFFYIFKGFRKKENKIHLISSSTELSSPANLLTNVTVSSSSEDEDSSRIIKGKFWRKPIKEINDSMFTSFSTHLSETNNKVEKMNSFKNDMNYGDSVQAMVACNIKNALLNNCSEVFFLIL